MPKSTFESLPDELLIDISDYLNLAQDVSHLAQTSRRTHTLIEQDGWGRFVRSRFTNWSIPSTKFPSREGWRTAADRLTYLDRCWDRRAVLLVDFREKQIREGGRNAATRRAQQQQSVGFHPALSAGLLPGGGGDGELAAWGVGENLITRVSVEGKANEWYLLNGRKSGYAAGTGDVTAVATLETDGAPAVIVGRANGDLDLLHAAGPKFGKSVRKSSDGSRGSSSGGSYSGPSSAAVSWTEWHQPSKLLASSRGTLLSLHQTKSSGEAGLRHMLHQNMALQTDPGDVSLIRSIKFMNGDTIAVSLGGTSQPLRLGKLSPTGISFNPLPRHPDRATDFLLAGANLADRQERTTVRAIEPVGESGTLLLSAWDDGGNRLIDIRTPSLYEASYRDYWQPYEPGSSLLVYGTRHFVAGSNVSPDLRFFDFRYPKPYYHTDGFPCSDGVPTPRPPFMNEVGHEKLTRCDHAAGQECSWHTLSKQPIWRPDATLHTGHAWRSRIHAFAKASDVSSRFYIGFEGAVVEANLTLTHDMSQGSTSSEHTAPEGWEATPAYGRVRLIENGVGLVDEEEWKRARSENLKIWHQDHHEALKETSKGMQSENAYARLDQAYMTLPPRKKENTVRRNHRGRR